MNAPIAPLEFEKPLVELERLLENLKNHSDHHKFEVQNEISNLTARIAETRAQIHQNLTPWQRVQIVRHPQRPYTLDYLARIASDFTELHGDRLEGDDQALIGGLATIDGEKMVVIGHQKGRNTKESLKRNFGCAHPEGYRKALRLMRLANKFDLPIVSMIDTPGAYPGVAAEERHIAEAIAVNIREMFTFEVPILAIVIGEGGSGGALGIGVANRVLVLENAYYSVISPEGCASILWRDRKFTAEAAAALKMSAKDLLELGLVEGIVPEPERGAHHDWDAAAEALKISLLENVRELKKLSPKQRIEQRQERFRNLGIFSG
jgi:acetyl-CoA carboxylase carboxyl transferase subunit alpha